MIRPIIERRNDVSVFSSGWVRLGGTRSTKHYDGLPAKERAFVRGFRDHCHIVRFSVDLHLLKPRIQFRVLAGRRVLVLSALVAMPISGGDAPFDRRIR